MAEAGYRKGCCPAEACVTGLPAVPSLVIGNTRVKTLRGSGYVRLLPAVPVTQ
jgi:hypothetical protein